MLTLLLSISLLAIPAPTQPDDLDAIRATVTQFAAGADAQDTDRVAGVLHPEAQQFYAGPDGLARLPRHVYLDLLTQKKIGGAARVLAIESVTVDGDIAQVRAVMKGEAAHFTTYLSLMRLGGAWQIVSVTLRMEML